MSILRVAELFAGVGGFRVGFDNANRSLGREVFQVVWSNQWEPSTKAQHASDIYVRNFGPEGHSNDDIATVPAEAVPQTDLLVGGFPCQDYSVANTLQRASGLVGKKGVLWWEIYRLLAEMPVRPPYVLLENVDRLLKSPASHRGRDFAIMLASLSDLGYAVEWRVINAADYGMPQRRKRVFILAYLNGTPLYEKAVKASDDDNWLAREGIFGQAFPAALPENLMFASPYRVEGTPVEITEGYPNKSQTPFRTAGLMVDRNVIAADVTAIYSGPQVVLGDVLVDESDVPAEFYIGDELEQWEYLKGSKTLLRVNKATGHEYKYSEGSMTFPDALDRPSRTIITGEGGVSPSRFKHVIRTSEGKYRRLVPVELERLNMFPDNHTAGVTDSRRAFLMGNALVTGVIEKIGKSLIKNL